MGGTVGAPGGGAAVRVRSRTKRMTIMTPAAMSRPISQGWGPGDGAPGVAGADAETGGGRRKKKVKREKAKTASQTLNRFNQLYSAVSLNEWARVLRFKGDFNEAQNKTIQAMSLNLLLLSV